MYAWIWAHLPGNWPIKALTSAVLLAVAVALLWFAAFPAAERRLPFNDVTVNAPAGSSSAP